MNDNKSLNMSIPLDPEIRNSSSSPFSFLPTPTLSEVTHPLCPMISISNSAIFIKYLKWKYQNLNNK